MASELTAPSSPLLQEDPSGVQVETKQWNPLRTAGRFLPELLHRSGGVVVLAVMVVAFSIALPSLFPRLATLWEVLNTNAITAMAALVLVIPLAAGMFDISIPYTMTLSGVICTSAIVYSHDPIWLAILLALIASAGIGLLNAVVIVGGGVQSLVATLATGFVIQALADWVSNTQIISSTSLLGHFQKIAFGSIVSTIQYPVIYAFCIAVVLWIILQHTGLGRRIYACGFRPKAARLASVKVAKIRFWSLVAAAILAGITGVVLASNLGSGSPTAGTDYLLPAFAGIFLGTTQITPGRFNAWGTVLAVLMLGTLATGLGLASVPLWTQQLADGIVLIVALLIHATQSKSDSEDRLTMQTVKRSVRRLRESLSTSDIEMTTLATESRGGPEVLERMDNQNGI